MRNASSVPARVGRLTRIALISCLGVAAVAGCSDSAADNAGSGTASPGTVQAPQTPAPASSRVTGGRTESPGEKLLPTTPPPYSAAGALVPGFPVDLIPVPDGAEILVSSAVPVGNNGVQEVSLNLRTPATAAALMGVYRAALLAAGFLEAAPTGIQAGLAEESTFTRSSGDEILVVGILDQNGARTVTIGGRVRVPTPAPLG